MNIHNNRVHYLSSSFPSFSPLSSRAILVLARSAASPVAFALAACSAAPGTNVATPCDALPDDPTVTGKDDAYIHAYDAYNAFDAYIIQFGVFSQFGFVSLNYREAMES